MFKYITKIMLPLLIICVFISAVLAFVYQSTYEKAEENLERDMKISIESIFTQGITYSMIEAQSTTDCIIYEVKKDSVVIGYAANVMSGGFGGDINMMIGFEQNGKIKSVKIIALSETPGLGSRVAEGGYLSQYDGKSGELVIKQDIDAIAGATISSKAVLAGVNRASSILAQSGLIGGEHK